MPTLVFAGVTVVGVATLASVRTLRPDREAKGLTEVCVLLAAYGAVYGPVGIGFVLQVQYGPDLANLPAFIGGALMGALLATLVAGGMWLATALALWVLRRPLELPTRRMGVRTAVLLVAAFALVFGSGMALLEAVEDRSAGLLWVGMGEMSRSEVRGVLSGIGWAVGMTACTMLVIAPLYEADRHVLGVMATATANTLYFVALGVMMRRVEYATDL